MQTQRQVNVLCSLRSPNPYTDSFLTISSTSLHFEAHPLPCPTFCTPSTTLSHLLYPTHYLVPPSLPHSIPCPIFCTPPTILSHLLYPIHYLVPPSSKARKLPCPIFLLNNSCSIVSDPCQSLLCPIVPLSHLPNPTLS